METHMHESLKAAGKANIEALPFKQEEFDGKTQPVLRMGRYRVPRWTLIESWEKFWLTVGSLKPKKKHSSEDLFGDEGWSLRRKRDRINVGRCFTSFARTGVLPITEANPGKSGPRRFLLNTTLLDSSPANPALAHVMAAATPNSQGEP